MRIKSRHDPLAKFLPHDIQRDLPGGAKYRNEKITNEYGTFDSKHEFDVFMEYQLLLRAGLVSRIDRQVVYMLIPKQDGERSVTYRADLVVYYPDGHFDVIDAKGLRTKEYIIKRKLMLWLNDIRIIEK